MNHNDPLSNPSRPNVSPRADLSGFRVLVVHAHPDDEALFTGGTIAALRAAGAHVYLVTCTLGEEGEVIGKRLAHLVAHEADQLGGARLAELDAAASVLGVSHHLLGGAGFFRDSGMAGTPSHANPRALVNRVDEAAGLLAHEVASFRPHVVLTYGPDGGYGHPDHIAVHRAVHQAVEQVSAQPSARAAAGDSALASSQAAAGDSALSPRIWWAIFHRAEHYAALKTITAPPGWQIPDKPYLDNFTNAESAVAVALGDEFLSAKISAMAAHATQIWLANGHASVTNSTPAWAVCSSPQLAPVAYALSNLYVMPVLRREHFQLGAPGAAPWPGESAGGAYADAGTDTGTAVGAHTGADPGVGVEALCAGLSPASFGVSAGDGRG